jgi:hypothetical protein
MGNYLSNLSGKRNTREIRNARYEIVNVKKEREMESRECSHCSKCIQDSESISQELARTREDTSNVTEPQKIVPLTEKEKLRVKYDRLIIDVDEVLEKHRGSKTFDKDGFVEILKICGFITKLHSDMNRVYGTNLTKQDIAQYDGLLQLHTTLISYMMTMWNTYMYASFGNRTSGQTHK